MGRIPALPLLQASNQQSDPQKPQQHRIVQGNKTSHWTVSKEGGQARPQNPDEVQASSRASNGTTTSPTNPEGYLLAPSRLGNAADGPVVRVPGTGRENVSSSAVQRHKAPKVFFRGTRTRLGEDSVVQRLHDTLDMVIPWGGGSPPLLSRRRCCVARTAAARRTR